MFTGVIPVLDMSQYCNKDCCATVADWSGSASVSALVDEERMCDLKLGSWSLTPSSASRGFRNLGRFLHH